MPLRIGENPDWRLWPEKGRYPTIKGERWMLCTDGCYFVSMDRPGMLIPAERNCDVCGCPLHPGRSALLARRDQCAAHQEGVATRTVLHDQDDDDEEGDWEEDEDEDEDEDDPGDLEDEDWDADEDEDEEEEG